MGPLTIVEPRSFLKAKIPILEVDSILYIYLIIRVLSIYYTTHIKIYDGREKKFSLLLPIRLELLLFISLKSGQNESMPTLLRESPTATPQLWPLML